MSLSKLSMTDNQFEFNKNNFWWKQPRCLSRKQVNLAFINPRARQNTSLKLYQSTLHCHNTTFSARAEIFSLSPFCKHFSIILLHFNENISISFQVNCNAYSRLVAGIVRILKLNAKVIKSSEGNKMNKWSLLSSVIFRDFPEHDTNIPHECGIFRILTKNFPARHSAYFVLWLKKHTFSPVIQHVNRRLRR